MGAPMRQTSAVTNSEPSSHGSGTPARRAKAPPTAAATNVPAAAANRRRKIERGLGEAGASSFMPPRASAIQTKSATSIARMSRSENRRPRLRGRRARLSFDPGSGGGRRGGAHRLRQRQRLVGAVEELDGHEDNVLVADIFKVVHLELAGPVGLVASLARLVGVFHGGAVMHMLAA